MSGNLNGNGSPATEELDEREKMELALRQKKSLSFLTSVRIAREMIEGGMQGKPGETRLETDPDGFAQDLADFFSFAKGELAEGGDLPLDWKAILKVDPIRATALADLIDAPIPYILKPLIVEGSLTQIQGIQKGGKSAFSLYLALCLATGTWVYPQYFRAPNDEPQEVLYLAWEDPEIMMAKRLSLYAAALPGLSRKFLPDHLTFLFCPDLFVEEVDHELALRAAIAELKPKVIFIDTLSHIHGAEENSSSEMKVPMKRLAQIAKDLKVGIVYLHHTGKGSGDKLAQDKSRGSGAIAAAWHVLIDWGTREKGSNVNPVEIQSKYEQEWRHWAIAYEPQKDDVGDVVAVNWAVEGSGEAQAAPKGPRASTADRTRARLIETFKELHKTSEWVTVALLRDASNLGLDRSGIFRYLKAMCLDGLVEDKKVSKNPKDPLHYRLTPRRGNLEGTLNQ